MRKERKTMRMASGGALLAGLSIPALLGVILSIPTGLAAAGPTLDEILAKHLEARGGAARLARVTSLECTGTATIFSEQAPFTIIRRRPDRYRFERRIMGSDVVSGYDGRTAWWRNAGMGADWPVLMPLPDSVITRREADFDGPLVDYADKGHRIELAGLDDLDGEEVYKLVVTLNDGAEETWYLDPQSYLQVARVSTASDYGTEMPGTTWFSDFREVDGIVLPHRIEKEYGTRNEVLAVETVRFNVDVDETRFRMPPPEGMEALAPLVGEWDLKVETRPYPQAPWSEHVARSTITSLLGGRLLEERFSYVDRGVPTDVVRTYSFDRFREVYRLTQVDTFTGHMSVLEGPLADGRLAAANVESGTGWQSGETEIHTRMTLYEIEPDGFRIDGESSTDGGESWTADLRLTYTRR